MLNIRLELYHAVVVCRHGSYIRYMVVQPPELHGLLIVL